MQDTMINLADPQVAAVLHLNPAQRASMGSWLTSLTDEELSSAQRIYLEVNKRFVGSFLAEMTKRATRKQIAREQAEAASKFNYKVAYDLRDSCKSDESMV